MIIRHAKKPGDADPDHGVSWCGVHDRHDLTVRGWQRAGALVRFFAPIERDADRGAVSTPATIIAAAVTLESPSLRAMHTVQPLAAALGIAIDTTHANGEEQAVAAVAMAAALPVLIAWHHSHVSLLAHAIGGPTIALPRHWPDDRFDMIWTLDQPAAGAPWMFGQTPQMLLPGDRIDPI